MAPRPTKEQLETEYWAEDQTLTRMAQSYHQSPGTLRRWFNEYGIARRSASEIARLSHRGYPKGEQHHRWRGGPQEVQCDYCGATLQRLPHRLRKQARQFCDVKCKAGWQSEFGTGPLAGNWRGGIWLNRTHITGYGSYRKLREEILARDGKCVLCGSQTKLCMHHIKERSKHPELTLEYANLVTLCRQCHLELHSTASQPVQAALLVTMVEKAVNCWDTRPSIDEGNQQPSRSGNAPEGSETRSRAYGHMPMAVIAPTSAAPVRDDIVRSLR